MAPALSASCCYLCARVSASDPWLPPSLCVFSSTSSLSHTSFGFLSLPPPRPFYMSVISNPLATQNEGCPLSCPLGSLRPQHLRAAPSPAGSRAMARSHSSPTMGALSAGQQGLGQVPTRHREEARPRRGSESLAIRPSRAARTCCGVWSKSLDLCLTLFLERK